ncbi:MAG: DEAD/DEAH box helicase [Candidatus Thorarchaeota archaeon]|jgi:replicative superfamily II helicase
MSEAKPENDKLKELRGQLKALANRYSVEILQVLNPETGDMIPSLGWDSIVDGVLDIMGIRKPKVGVDGEKSQEQVQFEKTRKRFASGGTLYESMNKLVQTGFVQATGTKGKKQRRFLITHQGRLALSAVVTMQGPISDDTEVKRAAQILLRHKNYVRLLPAQEKFLREVGEIRSNLVIQMPPGSGKTFLAMIAVLNKLQKGMKCLYLSPYISLSRQIIEEYGALFEDMGYSVVRYDGQSRVTDADLENANLVVGMFESVLSSVLERKKWTDKFELIVVDELTELDSSIADVQSSNLGTDRSAKLDCLLALIKSKANVITLSSRFGETEEVAQWLDADTFRPSARLSPDEFIVSRDQNEVFIQSSDGTQNTRVAERGMLEAVIEHLGDYQNKSVLVVVSYRDRTEYVANQLGESHPRSIDERTLEYIIGTGEDMLIGSRLREILKKGVAFHHAGLPTDVRGRLEERIKSGGIRTVISTTGITSGISFPFDCVIILYDRSMRFLTARSRYLQIAGRIGEYYLAQHEGRVYLIFEEPTRAFETVGELEHVLLHRPLEPLNPGALAPSLIANLVMREAVKRRKFDKKQIETAFLDCINETFRSTVDEYYSKDMKMAFGLLFTWLEKEGLFEDSAGKYKLTTATRNAVTSGIDILKYARIRNDLETIHKADDSELIDLLLQFDLPQAIRPKTLIPTDIELRVAKLNKPNDWYRDLVNGRRKVKEDALDLWLKEDSISDVISHANQFANISLDEGDLGSFVGICSDLAGNISRYLKAMKKTAQSKRMETFSRQLRYGVRDDLAGSDLLELVISHGNESPLRKLSRTEARILLDNGYKTIEELVRKDIDASKKGLARDRFAENSGLDAELAKHVYKAAIEHIRPKSNDED